MSKITELNCPECSGEIAPTDKFCSNCGAALKQLDDAVEPAETPRQPSLSKSDQLQNICPLCGQINSSDVPACESCGAALDVHVIQTSPTKQDQQRKKYHAPPGHEIGVLQSWKVPASAAVIIVIGLLVVRFSHRDNVPAGLSPTAQTALKEIESLQKAIETNPRNEKALLRLADIYYDMKIFDRAIIMYDRYLEINPSNPDARVDLGTSYFQLALADSAHRDQYFESAKNEMKKALTYNPRHQLAQYNLGMVSLHTGDLDEANEWFRRCVKVDSSSETGQRALQLIK